MTTASFHFNLFYCSVRCSVGCNVQSFYYWFLSCAALLSSDHPIHLQPSKFYTMSHYFVVFCHYMIRRCTRGTTRHIYQTKLNKRRFLYFDFFPFVLWFSHSSRTTSRRLALVTTRNTLCAHRHRKNQIKYLRWRLLENETLTTLTTHRQY